MGKKKSVSMPISRRSLPALASLGGLLLAMGAAAEPAEQANRDARALAFSIPAQSLSSALLQFSETSGIQVFFNADLVRRLNSPALQERLTPYKALGKLLEGSGLGFRVTSGGSITIGPKPSAPTGGDASATLGKVVVAARVLDEATAGYSVFKSATASKTDTPIFDTPAAIQVVPREVMDDQKSTRIRDALENVSGVRPQPTLGLGTWFVVRGFHSPSTYRNGLITNGANAGFPGEFDMSTIEGVEVLKGPAAVLYGRIEPGGLVNLTTKKPLDKPYYSLEQQFGNYDFYRTQWDTTGPVNNDGSLLYRFTGAYQDNQSFRDLISNDRLAISPTVTWKPTDATDITVNIEGLVQNYQADFGIPAVGKRPARIPISNSFSDPNDPVDHQSKIHLGTLINHKFNEDWAVHSRFLATYDHGDQTFLSPAPAFGGALRADNRTLDRTVYQNETDAEAYSTNLDLTGKFKLGETQHNTLLGVDYTRAFTSYHVQGDWATPIPALAIDIYNPQASYGIDPRVIDQALLLANPATNRSVFKDEWVGLYLQDHVTLWDKLHLMAGGRYDWAETGRGNGTSYSEAGSVLKRNVRQDDGFSPRVGILYQPWRSLGLYGNWTTSFSANNGISATGSLFEPQRGEQFEAGIKTQLFDDRLVGTMAYYHITKDKILTADLSTPDPFDSKPIGQMRSQGIEMDLTGHITDKVSLIGSYAFTDARVTKDNYGNQGHRMTNVPEHSGSLWLKYDVNGHAARKGFSFGVGGVVAGQREGDFENSFQMPGYVRMDAFAAYKFEVQKARVTAQFNIRNLLDKRYFESTDPFMNVAPRLGVYPGAPLTAVGSIRVEY